MFSESKHIHIKIKQASKNLSISNTKNSLRLDWLKIRESLLLHFLITLITEFSRRRKDSYIDNFFLERPSMNRLFKNQTFGMENI
jgi:hypothetical protein